jgi:hypothetical protein
MLAVVEFSASGRASVLGMAARVRRMVVARRVDVMGE